MAQETSGVPTRLIRLIMEEWKVQYGPTFPLYGNETKRHDISGSVRPLLASTEIKHEKILAEKSGVSKRILTRIMNEEVEFVSEELSDRLFTAMDRADVWYNELSDYR
jgi:hypothetical protein